MSQKPCMTKYDKTMGIAAVLVGLLYNTETKTYEPLSTYQIQKKAKEILDVQLRTEEVKLILMEFEEEKWVNYEIIKRENRLPCTYWKIKDRAELLSHMQNLGKHPFMKNSSCLQIREIQEIINTQSVV